MLTVSIKDQLPKFTKVTEQKLDVALFRMANDIRTTSAQLAPRQTGALRSSHSVQRTSNGKNVEYQTSANTPYARRRHYENRKNPNTLQYLKRAGDQNSRNLGRYYKP